MGKTSPESNGIVAGVYFVFFLLEDIYLVRMRKHDYDINLTDTEQTQK